MSEKSSNVKVCCFCSLAEDNELEFGKLYEYDGIVTHYYCLLLSSKMEQKGKDNEGILGFLINDIKKELRRGKRCVCYYCKRSGATLGCCNTKCKRMFHYPCGLRAGTLNQFFGEFRSYCINHRPQQKVDGYLERINQKHNDSFCYICYDKVDLHDLIGTLWAPCCKKDAWFHRKCIQQLAMNAGYFFKCPLCNNNKEFQNEMLEYGIYIPSQDASWELEPNAFQELLYRHNRCDAVTCLCPKGRNHTSMNAKWELTLCRICGSQGIHMACGQLKWAKPIWNCDECISILGKIKKSDNLLPEMINITHHDTDADSSDSEISVGGTQDTENLPTSSLSCMRPGPLSFKLQQNKANKSTTRNKGQDNVASSTQNSFVTLSPEVSSSLNLQSTKNTDMLNICSSSKDESVSEPNCEQSLQCTQQTISTVGINKTDMHITDRDDDNVNIVSSSTSKKRTLASCGKRTKTKNLKQPVDISCNASTSLGVYEQATSDKMPNTMNNMLSIENEERKSDNIKATQKSLAAVADNTESITLSRINNHMDIDNSLVKNINITNERCLMPNDFTSTRDLKNASNDTISPINTNPLMNNPSSKNAKIKNVKSKSLEAQCSESQSRSKRKYETNMCIIGTHINEHKMRLTDKYKRIKGNGMEENTNGSSSASTCDITNMKNRDQINIQSLQNKIKNENVNMDQQITSNNSMQNNVSNRNSTINIRPSIFKMTNYNTADGKINNNQSLIPSKSINEDVIKSDILYNNTFKSVSIGTNGTMSKVIQPQNVDNAEIKSRKRSIMSQCDGDADIRSTGESTDSNAATESNRINPEGEPTTANWANLLHCTAHRRSVSDKDYISISPSTKTKICSAFSEIASNPNTCDKPRLIPKSVPLQDLKFKVRDSSNLQMILYDTFSVNITMNNTIKNHTKDPSTSTGVCNMENALLYLDEKTTVATCSRIQHSCHSHLTNDKSKRTADTGVSKNVINNHADAKENFHSVIKLSFVNVSNNFSIVNVFDDKCQLMAR